MKRPLIFLITAILSTNVLGCSVDFYEPEDFFKGKLFNPAVFIGKVVSIKETPTPHGNISQEILFEVIEEWKGSGNRYERVQGLIKKQKGGGGGDCSELPVLTADYGDVWLVFGQKIRAPIIYPVVPPSDKLKNGKPSSELRKILSKYKSTANKSFKADKSPLRGALRP